MARMIQDPNSPATTSQTYTIHQLGGGDVRNLNLTKQQASDMIERLMKRKKFPLDDFVQTVKNMIDVLPESFKKEHFVGINAIKSMMATLD